MSKNIFNNSHVLGKNGEKYIRIALVESRIVEMQEFY
jgi:hypothetical protein